MKYKTMNIIVLITLLLLALTACGTEDASPTDPLVEKPDNVDEPDSQEPSASLEIEGIKWTLLYLGKSSPIPGSEITAEFVDGQISGNASCNQYFGEFTLKGTEANVGMLGSTEMACMEPEGMMEQESRYLSFLSEIMEVDLAGGQLILTKADGDSLVFAPWTEPEAVSLDNTIWNLLIIGDAQVDGEAVSFTEYAILETTVIMAEFEDGKIFGTAGCNTYNASVEYDGWNLAIGPAMSTRMFCGEPEGLMDQEAKFLEILGGIERYGVDTEGHLVLTGANGSRLTFAPYVQPEIVEIDSTAWKLVEVDGSLPVEGTEITAQFLDGNISGSSGCNTYNAGFSVEGSSLDIGMAISTLMFCEEQAGTMDQEQAYMAALAEVTTFRMENGMLFLGNEGNGDLLVFEPLVK